MKNEEGWPPTHREFSSCLLLFFFLQCCGDGCSCCCDSCYDCCCGCCCDSHQPTHRTPPPNPTHLRNPLNRSFNVHPTKALHAYAQSPPHVVVLHPSKNVHRMDVSELSKGCCVLRLTCWMARVLRCWSSVGSAMKWMPEQDSEEDVDCNSSWAMVVASWRS